MPTIPSTARRISDSSLAQSIVGTQKRLQVLPIGAAGASEAGGRSGPAGPWAQQPSCGAAVGRAGWGFKVGLCIDAPLQTL